MHVKWHSSEEDGYTLKPWRIMSVYVRSMYWSHFYIVTTLIHTNHCFVIRQKFVELIPITYSRTTLSISLKSKWQKHTWTAIGTESFLSRNTNMISKMCDFDEKAYLDMYRSPSYSYTVCVQLSLVFETHYYMQFHI